MGDFASSGSPFAGADVGTSVPGETSEAGLGWEEVSRVIEGGSTTAGVLVVAGTEALLMDFSLSRRAPR